MIIRKTSFSNFIISFCRYLRDHEFVIGPEEQKDTFSAISLLSLNNKSLLQSALKSTLVKNHKQYLSFDRLFDDYWNEYQKGVDSKEKSTPAPTFETNRKSAINNLKNWLYNNKVDEKVSVATYSYAESKGTVPFRNISEDEVPELRKLIKIYVEKLVQNKTRRKVLSTKGRQLAIRNIIRAGLRDGGELLRLYYRIPKKHEPKLFLLCDVSRSMDLYSLFMIKFIYAFRQTFRNVEVFIFSTQLRRVSKYLRESTIDRALEKISENFSGWSGGTRIGECLNEFTINYSRKIDKNSLLLILSDGIDQGNYKLISKSMKKLSNKSGKIIWFNPLAGYSKYQPETKAMKAVIPYIDRLLPLYDFESFKAIC